MTILKTSGTIVKLNTNSLGSGTFNMSEGFLDISVSLVYGNNVPGAKILLITVGNVNYTVPGYPYFGSDVWSNPSAGTTYNFTTRGYLPVDTQINSNYYIIVSILPYSP
jgi:hypothetical protein